MNKDVYINIGLDLLELFKHIIGVRFFLRHSVYLSTWVTKRTYFQASKGVRQAISCEDPKCLRTRSVSPGGSGALWGFRNTSSRQNYCTYVVNTAWVKKIPISFLTFFPKRVGIFGPNFKRLLRVPIYTRLQIFIQLSPTVTKLWHQRAFQPMVDVLSIMVVALNMA